MSENEDKILGRARKLTRPLFSFKWDNRVISFQEFNSASLIAGALGVDPATITETTVYTSGENFAYDQTEDLAKQILGDLFDHRVWVRQQRAKKTASDEGLTPQQRLMRKALAKLSADERAVLGLADNVIVLPTTRDEEAAPPAVVLVDEILNEVEEDEDALDF